MKKITLLSAITFLFFTTTAQNGNVGIGTTLPKARLHVADSSVVFTADGIAASVPGAPPVSGTGRRMMWYADKAAFRVGYADMTVWDKDQVGNYSFATGNSSIAYGMYSIAMGTGGTATASGAISLGGGNNAAGFYSIAAGYFNRTKSSFSVAVGDNNVSSDHGGFVAGTFNDTSTVENDRIGPDNRIFQIGNGYRDDARSNAITVLQNGNAGFSTTLPAAKIDINGDLAIREKNLLISIGNNHNVLVGLSSFVNFGNPTAAFTITGIQGGVDGKILTILNTSTFNMTIANLNAGSDPVNRINTLTGADIVTNGNGSVTLQYSIAHNRWMVIAVRD